MRKKTLRQTLVLVFCITLINQFQIAEGATKKSTSYKKGADAINLSSRSALDTHNLYLVFGVNGKPIRSKALAFCEYLLDWGARTGQYRTTANNINDWKKGCTDAIMKLRDN
jgi:hypothetical protein